MLKKIIIDNFKTFIKPTEIDFKATSYKFLENENVGKNRILKGTLFVGENASGKTQILKAIKFLLDLLFLPTDVDFFQNKSFYTKKNKYTLQYFFEIKDIEIEYKLLIGIDKIISEELICNKKVIIKRSNNKAIFNYNDEKVFDDLSSKLLFLRRIYFDTHFYDDEILNKWIDFLKNSLYVNCHDHTILSYSNKKYNPHDYLNENGASPINKIFKDINYNQEIAYDFITHNEKGTFNMASISEDKFISFKKNGTNVYIPEDFESTGNITLIHLLPAFIHAIKTDCILIIDEFSSGFHNELEEALIKYFYHYAKNSQLIFVSHSTNILNNTIMRPDQIYSVSFKPKEGTVLKRFSDEMPREAQNTEKMYLSGVFDGMPKYNKNFKN